VLLQFLDHLELRAPEFFHDGFVEEDDFLLIGQIFIVNVKSSLENSVKYLTELGRVVFFAVDDVTDRLLVFILS
jgi:hypothetical protein